MKNIDITIKSEPVKCNKRKLNVKHVGEREKYKLVNKPTDFIVYHHTKPKKESNFSSTSINILPELVGVQWNGISMCYVLSLNPSAIRISDGMVTADSLHNRITVMVNNLKDLIITQIYMEVSIPVPNDYTGYDLRIHLNKLKNKDFSPHVPIFKDGQDIINVTEI